MIRQCYKITEKLLLPAPTLHNQLAFYTSFPHTVRYESTYLFLSHYGLYNHSFLIFRDHGLFSPAKAKIPVHIKFYSHQNPNFVEEKSKLCTCSVPICAMTHPPPFRPTHCHGESINIPHSWCHFTQLPSSPFKYGLSCILVDWNWLQHLTCLSTRLLVVPNARGQALMQVIERCEIVVKCLYIFYAQTTCPSKLQPL